MRNPEQRVPDMLWSGWGVADRHVPLSDDVRGLVQQALGITQQDTPAVDEADVTLPPNRLDDSTLQPLVDVVGAEHVRTDDPTRLRHAAGRSTTDLLRLRAGSIDRAPDAVVLPASHDEVLAVLNACAEAGIAVVPFGGGTSVVGGVDPRTDGFQGVIAVDVRRLASLVAIDPVAQTATLDAGLKGPEAEALLAAEGWTLGHWPQSFEHASLGGFAATRSAGQASAGYGRFDDMVVAMRVATPAGTLDVGRAPASAAGPDLRQLFLGSEGTLGVITRLTVRVRPRPEQVVDEAWRFPDFATGAAALRRLAQDDIPVTVARLSDETETGVNQLLDGTQPTGGCLAIIAYEGTAERVAVRRQETAAALQAAGGAALGEDAAAGWRDSRFAAPYLRDSLLDAGALVETLETAAWWSSLDATRQAVQRAVSAALADSGAQPMVLCHVSHIYPTGASLYFTVLTAAGPDPVARWQSVKRAATEAIMTSGATLTHHHAVGADHAPWLAAEDGPLGVDVLRAVKARLDPAGICNPGTLLPPPT